MRIQQRRFTAVCLSLLAVLVGLVFATDASAVSDKLLFTAQFGREVNLTKATAKAGAVLEDSCPVDPADVCQPGKQNSIAGGFTFPSATAVDPETKSVYVADTNNNRIEKLAADGEFLLTFGKNVNKKGGNVCTKAEESECQSGEKGTGLAGDIWGPQDVAIDPTTHDVYVGDLFYKRIDVFTALGEFVLMIGGNVDKTKVVEGATEAERNVCTKASKDECQAGQFAPEALKQYLNQGSGDLLAFGPGDVLYVGDEERVQKFGAGGEYKGEVSLTSLGAGGTVKALAVDAAGKLYLSYSRLVSSKLVGGEVVHEYASDGKEVSECTVPNQIIALAVDPFGRIAATESGVSHGVLYTPSCEELGVFGPPNGMQSAEGIAFNQSAAELELYVADGGRQDVERYALAPVLEAVTGPPPPPCAPGTPQEASATFNCTLHGEIDPNAVAGTISWFAYGTTAALGTSTAHQTMLTGSGFVPIEALVEGLRPNETYYYRAAGEDENTGGEPATGKTVSFVAPSVPPGVTCGTPEVSYVTFTSAVLACRINPENALTAYSFQYGACSSLDACPIVTETDSLESNEYGTIGVRQTAESLQPATTYRFRLTGVNEHHEETVGSEGEFTTAQAPKPTAVTEGASGVGATGATLAGVVDPDGAQATYSFEVGVYNGASTVYSTVVQGSAGPEAGPELKHFTLGGLQPGTTYAYRIRIASAYGTVYGAVVTFPTASLPEVWPAPAAPSFVSGSLPPFPKEVGKPKAPTRAEKLARALKACAKKPKAKRAACRRSARARYAAPVKKAHKTVARRRK